MKRRSGRCALGLKAGWGGQLAEGAARAPTPAGGA